MFSFEKVILFTYEHYILKPVRLYHRTLKPINGRYENKDVIVEAEQNFDIAKKVDKEISFVRLIT